MPRLAKALLAAATAMIAMPAAGQDMASEDSRPELALMGTIPIYWGEAAGFDAILAGEGEMHWARAEIERDWRIAPLDYLSAEELAGHRFLMLAQPRGFTAEENVALDGWVRGGGKLLLFADPLMTGHSQFGLGDRRRPQDTVLLSPILAHWGLELHFDEIGDDAGSPAFGGFPLPVEWPGRFALRDEGERDCSLESDSVVASCRIGEGYALLVADAAILNLEGAPDEAEAAFYRLLSTAMGMAREGCRSPEIWNDYPAESQSPACEASMRDEVNGL